MTEYFQRPVVKNPTRAHAGLDGAHLNTDRLSARLGGNTGNVAFIHAILRQVAGIRHVSEVRPGYGDVNVLGCSNQINPNIKKSYDDAVFNNTDAPFVAIGLGAQAPSVDDVLTIPEGTVGYIKRIQERAPGDGPNISVRGTYTYEVLQRAGLHERAVALGCPSHFIHPNPKLGVLISRKLARATELVAVSPGNITRPARAHAELETALAAMAEIGGGGYVLQHPKELFAMVRDGFQSVDTDLVDRIRANTRPDLDAREFRRWFRRNARIFTSATAWMEHLRSVDLVVGTRIHGCMLALQIGTPAVCLALDSRQTELCELLRVPYIPAAQASIDVSIERFRDLALNHDWSAYDENRLALAARYREFLVGNRLRPSPLLERLVA